MRRMLRTTPDRTPDPVTDYVSAAEAADLTGRHRATIGRWRDSGRVAHVRIGNTYLYRRADILAAAKGDR